MNLVLHCFGNWAGGNTPRKCHLLVRLRASCGKLGCLQLPLHPAMGPKTRSVHRAVWDSEDGHVDHEVVPKGSMYIEPPKTTGHVGHGGHSGGGNSLFQTIEKKAVLKPDPSAAPRQTLLAWNCWVRKSTWWTVRTPRKRVPAVRPNHHGYFFQDVDPNKCSCRILMATTGF